MSILPASLTGRRPVILGTAMQYDRAALTAFISSWREAVPEAALVLFACDVTSETLDWLRASGVEVVIREFNRPSHLAGYRLLAHQYRLSLTFRLTRLLLGGARGDASTSAARALFSVVNQRFYEYRAYLKAWRHRYSHVLLTDVRDVVFQRSPFPCAGLHVFAENETIGRSHFARRWFFLSYGPRSWRPFAERPLLNVGTTLGETDAVLRYLDAICAEFDRRSAFFWGADTAAHNLVVHDRRIEATAHEFGDGSAINLNAIDPSALRTLDGQLLDRNHVPYAVVHQYDRVKGLRLVAAERREVDLYAPRERSHQ